MRVRQKRSAPANAGALSGLSALRSCDRLVGVLVHHHERCEEYGAVVTSGLQLQGTTVVPGEWVFVGVVGNLEDVQADGGGDCASPVCLSDFDWERGPARLPLIPLDYRREVGTGGRDAYPKRDHFASDKSCAQDFGVGVPTRDTIVNEFDESGYAAALIEYQERGVFAVNAIRAIRTGGALFTLYTLHALFTLRSRVTWLSGGAGVSGLTGDAGGSGSTGFSGGAWQPSLSRQARLSRRSLRSGTREKSHQQRSRKN